MEARRKEHCGRVLVAEDDPSLRNVVRFHLERANYHVTACRDGAEAWAMLQRHSVDMVVTDMQMPNLTGVELCQKMRSQAAYEHLPVLMLTAKGLELDADRLREELGVVEVMFKPFSPKQLARAVAGHLRQAAERTA